MDGIFIYNKKFLIKKEYNLYRFSWITKRSLRKNMLRITQEIVQKNKLNSKYGVYKCKFDKKRSCIIINVSNYKMFVFTQIPDYYSYNTLRRFLRVYIKKYYSSKIKA